MVKTSQTTGKRKGKVLRVILYVLLGLIAACAVTSLVLYLYGMNF